MTARQAEIDKKNVRTGWRTTQMGDFQDEEPVVDRSSPDA
jgi:hypothetical protein